jgi:release factor glutamine methyltransferase
MKRTKLSELKRISSLPQEKFDFVVGETLKKSKTQLILDYPTLSLTQTQLNKFKKIEKALLDGTPPQYIFKKAWFNNLELFVTSAVLIPRPETEILVEQIINFLKNKPNATILDLGTGSGCIAISVSRLFPRSSVTACDISSRALAVARKNAAKYAPKIKFINSNLFSNIPGKFDLICANLPYLGENDDDLKDLKDPPLSLVGGPTGFELIEQALNKLGDHLNDNGLAIFELGYDQADKFEILAIQNGFRTKIVPDLNQYSRFAIVQSA